MGLFSDVAGLLGGSKAVLRKRMQVVCRDLGFDVLASDADGCMIGVTWQGTRYEMIVVAHERHALLRILSEIRFPPRRLPTDMCGALKAMNAKMHDCDYAEQHGARSSRFCVQGQMLVTDLETASFLNAVKSMLPRVTALDEYLAENGYVR